MARLPRASTGMALFATLWVTTAISLIGIAFLMSTHVESRIAQNELRAAQAVHAAEAGARAVQGWFERPGEAPGFPADTAIVLRARAALDESDPYGASPKSGGAQYKEGVDLDANGSDDLFEPPYRGDPLHTLLGAEAAPDMRITDEAWLDAFSRSIFGDYPDAGAGVRARIRRIDVYAPPYLETAAGWTRHGIGTVKVVAGIERAAAPGQPGFVSERTARVVLGQVPYKPPFPAVVQACGEAELVGPVGLRWGALAATGAISMPAGPAVPESLPRGTPGPQGGDALWTDDAAWISAFAAALDPSAPIFDPWVRVVAGGPLVGAPSGAPQPYAGLPPPAPGSPPPWPCCDGSNLFQHQSWLSCPDYDYATWKRVARSGRRGVRYHAWAPPDGFRENGTGPIRSFVESFAAAAGQPALWFFDSADGLAPHDDDADGEFDNLTPEILLDDAWGARGFVVVNAERLVVSGLADSLVETLHAPGEPSGAAAPAWVDLLYPSVIEPPFFPGAAGPWDATGPAIETSAAFRGILVTPGAFEALSGGRFIGTVVARSVRLDASVAPATFFHRDPLLSGTWPPPEWGIPRFIAAQVSVD